MRSAINIGILTLLSLVLTYALVSRVGAGTSDWNFCILAIALLALVSGWLLRRDHAPPLPPRFQWPLLAFVAFGMLQITPLPVSVVHALSPVRADLAAAMTPVVGTVSWTTLSTTSAATLDQLIGVCCYLLVFLVVRDLSWGSRDSPWRPAFPLIPLGGIEAALGLVQSYLPDSDGIARGNYVNRDHFAGFLEMCLPFAALFPLAVWKRARTRRVSPAAAWKACGLLSVAAVIFVAILRSQSRMGFLAALASLFVVAFLVLRTERAHNSGLLICSLATATLLAFLLLPTDSLIARFGELTPAGAISSDLRVNIWKDTFRLIRAFPLFGCGLGAFESSYPRFQTSAPMYSIDYAHNDYLQGIAELGVPAFLMTLLFVAASLRLAIRSGINAQSTQRRYLVLAGVGSFVAILLHSFVDFNLHIPSNALLLAWIAGILATPAPPLGSTRRGLNREPVTN